MIRTSLFCLATLMIAVTQPALGQASAIVYKCPGNVYTSERELSAKQADEKGCKVIEGTPITVIQGRAPAPRPASGTATTGSNAARPPEARVDPGAQRARDSDSRRILESELRREEERLAEMKREYNNGEP